MPAGHIDFLEVASQGFEGEFLPINFTAGSNPEASKQGNRGHHPIVACWKRKPLTSALSTSHFLFTVSPRTTPAKARLAAFVSRQRSMLHSRSNSSMRRVI